MNEICIIGVAGGSGSGKTTFATRLLKKIGSEHCVVLGQDSYYIDQSKKFDHDGGSVNFDHPDSLDFHLMAEHLKLLKKGLDINVPIYDFATHQRQEKTKKLSPKKVVFVDGILIFSQPNVMAELDHKIFIDCEEELRFSRRLDRDVKERGRTPEGVRAQLANQVKPMHDQFVAPSKALASDVVTVLSFDEKCEQWADKIKTKYSLR